MKSDQGGDQGHKNSSPRARQLLDDAYTAAAVLGLPLFPHGVAASTPITAAPYMLDFATLESDFGQTGPRSTLLGRLRSIVFALGDAGYPPEFMLLGGSFADRGCAAPKDLDGAIAYTASVDANPPAILQTIQASARAQSLDIRLIPLDVQPALSAKMIAFFALLYSQPRHAGSKPSLLIVNPLSSSSDAPGAG